MKYVVGCLLALGALCFAGKASAQDEVKPGLVCEIFDMVDALESLPTIAADKKVTVRRIDKDINVDSTDDVWPGTQLSDHFYVRWTGIIKIAKDGKYKFYTESDDGSHLFIDGKQVVDNEGLHAMEEKEGEVELKAGDHEIKVEMFENEGGAGCKASWSGDGMEKATLPASALFHKKDKDLDKDAAK
jgi:hypothetical protein